MIKSLALVFIGGGFGSALRFLLAKYLNSSASGIPYGTLIANVSGSLLIGIILGLALRTALSLKIPFYYWAQDFAEDIPPSPLLPMKIICSWRMVISYLSVYTPLAVLC